MSEAGHGGRGREGEGASRDPDGTPRWARALLRRLAGSTDAHEVLGDLEEAHRARRARNGRFVASLLTGIEALDMGRALLRERWRARGRVAQRPTDTAVRAKRRFSPISWLDVKLGLRMLVKHPGLSAVSALGLAVAVAIGAIGFGVIQTMTAADLPLDEGEQVVTIQNSRGFEPVRATHLHDLETWRDEMDALADVGFYRIVRRNLITSDGRIEPAAVAEVTASGFRIARVPPLLGRYLVEDDERKGSLPVVVIGYGMWQSRFGGSTDVVGQTLRIGPTAHTVVGVMPHDFGFPIDNRVWTPLRLDPADYQRGAAPAVEVFARLARGRTLEEAQSQLDALGQRAAALFPETHANLRPVIFSYAQQQTWGPIGWLLRGSQVLVSLLLVVIATNVAALFYARTATRAGEITVRTALGASRGRIAGQLFIEALVLSSVAAGAGLLTARSVLQRIRGMFSSGDTPFWWDFNLSATTILYGFSLAVVAAVIIGVVPALRATGGNVSSGLQRLGSGPKLGKVWTALIVGQVAAAVAVLPVALNGAAQMLHTGLPGPENATRQVLMASLQLDRESAPEGAPSDAPAERERSLRLQAELMRRLEAEPSISHVVLMSPAPWEDPDLEIEVQGGLPKGASGSPVLTGSRVPAAGWSRVEIDFFQALEVPMLVGRAFTAADASPGADVVIVSQTFVDRALGGEAALGRRIRGGGEGWDVPESERSWYTIVGVVPDFPKAVGPVHPEPKVYQPLVTAEGERTSFVVRVRMGEPIRFAERLREIAASVDPMLRVDEIRSMEEAHRSAQRQVTIMVGGVGVLSLSVLLLSLAGLYALMSFTVVRSRREIGIRSALGARPHLIMRSVLGRAIRQIAFGIVAGILFVGVVDRSTGRALLSGDDVFLLPTMAVLMGIVGVLAAWGPARRGLRVQPTEVLKAE